MIPKKEIEEEIINKFSLKWFPTMNDVVYENIMSFGKDLLNEGYQKSQQEVLKIIDEEIKSAKLQMELSEYDINMMYANTYARMLILKKQIINNPGVEEQLTHLAHDQEIDGATPSSRSETQIKEKQKSL